MVLQVLRQEVNMKSKSLLLVPLLFLSVILTACKTVEYQIVEKTTYVHTPIGDALTEKIIPPAPPSKEEYVEPVPKQLTENSKDYQIRVLTLRTEILKGYVIDLLKTTKDLNSRFDQIRWLEHQSEQDIEQRNKEEEERVKRLVNDMANAIKQRK